MTGPADVFEQALAAAFTSATEIQPRPEAGFRLRARAGRRQAKQTLAGLTSGLVLGAVVVLAVGSVVHGRLLPASTVTGGSGGMAMRAGELPVLPWDNSSSSPLGLSYGQSTLTHPVEVVGVESVSGRRCTAAVTRAMDSGLMRAPQRTCPDLVRPAVLVVTQLAAVQVTTSDDSGTAWVALILGQSDSRTLASYTSEHVGSRLAFVVSSRVWWAAEISRPVDTGVIDIGAGTEADAVEFVSSLGLRREAKVRRAQIPLPR
jgi:hypothetical protein